QEELAQIRGAAGDVAADEVRIVTLKLSWPHHGAGENALAETWRKALHLLFDGGSHVSGISVGHVTITPRRVPSGWSPRSIKKTGLREKYEGILRNPLRSIRWRAGLGRVPLRFADLFKRPAKVDGSCQGAFGRAPRHRAAERPVDFKSSHAVAVTRQLA